MKNQTSKHLKKTKEQLSIVKLIAGKHGLILVTRNKSEFIDDSINCWKLVTNLENITEIDEHSDAHIGGYYI